MKKIFFFAAIAAILSLSACKQNVDSASSTDNASVVMDNIMARKSVRSYLPQTIGDDTIQALLRAAMAAPSGMDVRPWSFVVLKDKTNFDQIFAGNMNLKKYQEAAVVIVVCADTTMPKRNGVDGQRVPNRIWRDDMGACTENLLLAAEAYGLGAVWTACYPFENNMPSVKKELSLPDEVVPYCVIPVGHHDGTTQPKDKWDESRIHFERW
ncbi:MAG: nitroreductase family protein [Bacteroidales bacterium]|nr:nitroreductase family protein [Bacteroidales bacterium]